MKEYNVLCTWILIADKASLHNVMNTTRFFVNPDIAEVESFRNRWQFVYLLAICLLGFGMWCCLYYVFSVAVHGVELDSSVPLIGQPPKPSFEDEFLRLHPKKTAW
jgi:hypothetical protein